MKNFLMLISICCLWSCSSQKKLELTDIPFQVSQGNVQEHIGGREESGSNAELKINLSEFAENLHFEKVYFRARALDCKLMTENGNAMIVASYTTSKSSTGSEGEKMQKVFDIGPNEAVLAYKDVANKLKYVKVTNIKDKAPVIYQGRPKN